MFSNNNAISKLQMKRLMILDLFATTILLVPALSAQISGKGGSIAIIIGCILSLLYAYYILKISTMYKDNYFHFMKRTLGKFVSWVFMLIYLLKFLVSFIFVLHMFVQVINETFLADISVYVLVIAMLLVTCYASVKGIEVRGRIGEILFYVVVLPIFIIILLSLSEINTDNVFPMLVESGSQVAYGGYLCFALFSALEMLLFVSPYVKGRKHIYRSVTGGILIVFGFVLLLFVATVGIFTVNGVTSERWPTVLLMQVVSLPGGFLSRQDGMMLAFWIGSIFILISGYLFYLSEISKHLVKTEKTKQVHLVWLLAAFALFAATLNMDRIYEHYIWFLAVVNVPTSVILPGIPALVNWFKNRNQQTKEAIQHE